MTRTRRMARDRKGIIEFPLPRHILIGNCHQSIHHPGSKIYYRFCNDARHLYKPLTQKEKKPFAQGVVRRLLTIGMRFLKYYTTVSGWVSLNEVEATKTVMNRLAKTSPPGNSISSLNGVTYNLGPDDRIHNWGGQLKSYYVENWLQDNDLVSEAAAIFDKLFLNPSHRPSEAGPGIALAAEGSFGNDLKIDASQNNSFSFSTE